ncbi:MAG TPA: ubiquitin-conjugating enzyme E2 [Pirellulaceae bacterium]|jgi:hypothetical protein|nr:ubiquitin-conjugating enzyme E2 [Pirellulaceae bacterium]
MSGVDDRTRLLEETGRRLDEVASRGDILDISRDSGRPDVFLLTFRGKGLAPSLTAGEKFVEGNEWRCELRFPFRYPERPPEVRWRTEIYHPNVPLSGWMSMDDLGMTWSPDAPLDSLCERLWDLVRYAYVDLDQTANFNAREWYASQTPGSFPLDDRTLSVAAKRKHDNVIHYRRVAERTDRGASRSVEPLPPSREASTLGAAPSESEVTFLGDVSAPARSQPAVDAPSPAGAALRWKEPTSEPLPTPKSPLTPETPPPREREEEPVGIESGTRIFEIRDAEPSDSEGENQEEAVPLNPRRRPALRPLPPPVPDEGIVFLE